MAARKQVASLATPNARKPKVNDTNVYTLVIAGKVYEAGVRQHFKIKPASTRKRGFGYQVTYKLSREQAEELVDLMADMGTPADESQYDEALAEQIQKDFLRFPDAVRPR